MSRSLRKVPIFGHAVADSDKPYKVAEHRRERHAARIAVRHGRDAPAPLAFGNPWKSNKDGKGYWLDAPPSAMRK